MKWLIEWNNHGNLKFMILILFYFFADSSLNDDVEDRQGQFWQLWVASTIVEFAAKFDLSLISV